MSVNTSLRVGPTDDLAYTTGRGFRLLCRPGSASRPANWANDTFYVCMLDEGWNDSTDNPQSTDQAEPTTQGTGEGQYLRKYVISSTSGLTLHADQTTYPGGFYIDVSQLPYPGCTYHVIGYRHFNDGTTKQQWYYGFSNTNEVTTTLDNRRELAHRTTWTEDWTAGLKDWTTDLDSPNSYDWEQHSGDATVGTYLRAVTQQGNIRSRIVFRQDAAWTAKVKVRQLYARHWASLTVMCGEENYFGINTSGGIFGYLDYTEQTFLSPGFPGHSGDLSPAPSAHTLGTWRELEMRGDGAGAIGLYVDGSLVQTITVGTGTGFSGALSVWLAHVKNAVHVENANTFAYADFGPLTVTGNFEVVGFTGNHSSKGFSTTSSFAIQGDNENVDFYGDAGGITLRPNNGQLVRGDTWPTGSFQANTPPTFLGPGQTYSTLKIAGNTHSHGSLICYVRRNDGTLVPDSEITGNSSGFSPTGTGDSTISLTGVTTDGIYVDLQGTNTANGTTTPPVWQKAEIRTAYDSAVAATITEAPTERDLYSVLSLGGASAAATGTLALRIPQRLSLAGSAAMTGALAVKAKTELALSAATAQASGTLALKPRLAMTGSAAVLGTLNLSAPRTADPVLEGDSHVVNLTPAQSGAANLTPRRSAPRSTTPRSRIVTHE